MGEGPNAVRVEVVGVFERERGDPDEERSPVLVLRDAATREVSIAIGSCEAFAIHLALGEQLVARPLTHDLAVRLLEKLSGAVARVVIGEGENRPHHASIYLNSPKGEIPMEADAGDAVALALRAEAPIYATEEVLSGAGYRGGEPPD